ncbi:MAG: hypothetical protein Q4C96_11490 [Planctomycetia bacterium]|nr:hypothetical protein [Planctomycetia bacterium]
MEVRNTTLSTAEERARLRHGLLRFIIKNEIRRRELPKEEVKPVKK